MRIHELKCWPEYFETQAYGKKPFEVRVNDRDYREGDLLALNEYDPQNEEYTGRGMLVQVLSVLDNPKFCKEGFVIMGTRPVRLLERRKSCILLPEGPEPKIME